MNGYTTFQIDDLKEHLLDRFKSMGEEYILHSRIDSKEIRENT